MQAVLPVDCASSLLVPFLGRLPHCIPCTSRIADISMDCNRAFGGARAQRGLLASYPLSRLTAPALPKGEPSMCVAKSLRKAKSRLPLRGRCPPVGGGEGKASPAAHVRAGSLFSGSIRCEARDMTAKGTPPKTKRHPANPGCPSFFLGSLRRFTPLPRSSRRCPPPCRSGCR